MVNATQAARILGISGNRMGELIAAGRIPAQQVGRQWLMLLDDVREFAKQPRPAGRPRKPAPDRP